MTSVCDTYLSVRYQIEDQAHWLRHLHSTEACQKAYVAARKASGLGASAFGIGEVFDAQGQHIAQISYNGRLWPAGPLDVNTQPLAEVPPEPRPIKSWLLFECAEDAVNYRLGNGTGGWIFVVSDSNESILFPWTQTPKEILESVFVQGRHGVLIGTDAQYWQDKLREMDPKAPILSKAIRPYDL